MPLKGQMKRSHNVWILARVQTFLQPGPSPAFPFQYEPKFKHAGPHISNNATQ